MAAVDDLNAAVAVVKQEADSLKGRVDTTLQTLSTVEQQLKDLQGQTAPDLGPAIQSLADLHAELAAVDPADVASAPPAA